MGESACWDGTTCAARPTMPPTGEVNRPLGFDSTHWDHLIVTLFFLSFQACARSIKATVSVGSKHALFCRRLQSQGQMSFPGPGFQGTSRLLERLFFPLQVAKLSSDERTQRTGTGHLHPLRSALLSGNQWPVWLIGWAPPPAIKCQGRLLLTCAPSNATPHRNLRCWHAGISSDALQ